MKSKFELPSQGFVFWPVGTGDSTTIAIDAETYLQIDIRQIEEAAKEDSPYEPVVDRLIELLPKKNSKPYLACFALTHPDKDHCQGFSNLLNNVHIGELWFTPRVFREYVKDLCDDAKVFKKEAMRRVKIAREQSSVDSGDRIRVIGYDDLLEEDDFKGFPKKNLTIPGNKISIVNGQEYSNTFGAFVHAPFKDDAEGERNDTSLGLQITLSNGSSDLKGLFFGDLAYPTLRKIFGKSNKNDLEWNVLLAPHHCSKCVMYWKDESDSDETLRRDIMNAFENCQQDDAYIVASCEPIPEKNKSGDNPPHAKAKSRYEEIVKKKFICTQEESDADNPHPIVVVLLNNKIKITEGSLSKKNNAFGELREAITNAQGTIKPPTEQVGFGHND